MSDLAEISAPSWRFVAQVRAISADTCDEDPEQDRRHGASKHLVSVRRGGCIAMASARSQARSNLPRQDAEALAEEDAAKAAEAASKSPARNEVAEDADELLDEIDALLEEQSVLTNFRQKG